MRWWNVNSKAISAAQLFAARCLPKIFCHNLFAYDAKESLVIVFLLFEIILFVVVRIIVAASSKSKTTLTITIVVG